MATNISTDSIHLVTDRYLAVSIKNAERGITSAGGMQRIMIYSAYQDIPSQLKMFMTNSPNQDELVQFLFDTWSNTDPEKFKSVKVY